MVPCFYFSPLVILPPASSGCWCCPIHQVQHLVITAASRTTRPLLTECKTVAEGLFKLKASDWDSRCSDAWNRIKIPESPTILTNQLNVFHRGQRKRRNQLNIPTVPIGFPRYSSISFTLCRYDSDCSPNDDDADGSMWTSSIKREHFHQLFQTVDHLTCSIICRSFSSISFPLSIRRIRSLFQSFRIFLKFEIADVDEVRRPASV